MSDDDLEAWAELRTLATNAVCFLELAESDDLDLPPIKRLEYEANAKASGILLARRLIRLLQDTDR